ncbi:hypothetical protein FB567DRAFT_599636 [Paraphoma chrysanthemicola]|uniref:Uncharacterized protein n=1 Tax=Paraphoma chrysanthemicola TaxID=798071 RepID=A0A8K0VQV5_9PLEO|nr:hypothetical protein FB567DRAFT_599636 [Paraphoma chrysanthemicola]
MPSNATISSSDASSSTPKNNLNAMSKLPQADGKEMWRTDLVSALDTFLPLKTFSVYVLLFIIGLSICAILLIILIDFFFTHAIGFPSIFPYTHLFSAPPMSAFLVLGSCIKLFHWSLIKLEKTYNSISKFKDTIKNLDPTGAEPSLLKFQEAHSEFMEAMLVGWSGPNSAHALSLFKPAADKLVAHLSPGFSVDGECVAPLATNDLPPGYDPTTATPDRMVTKNTQ